MRRAFARGILAAALCFALALTMGAAAERNMVQPGYEDPAALVDSEVIVVNSAGEIVIGGFIVSISDSRTYVVTDAIVAGEAPPYVFFSQVVTDDGQFNSAGAHQSTVEWVDQYNHMCLLSVPTTSDVLSAHTYAPIARVSYLSDGERVYRNYVTLENNDNLQVDWHYVVSEQTTARRDTSYISSISPDYLPGMFAVTDWKNQLGVVGGPVFNEDGVAVGMAMLWMVDDELTVQFNAALDDLIDCLYEKGIDFSSYEQEFTENAPSGGSSGGGGSGGSSGGSPSGGSYDGGGTTGGGSSGSGSSTGPSGGSGSGVPSAGGSSSGGSSLKSDIVSGAAIGLVCGLGAYIFGKLRKKGGKSVGTANSASQEASFVQNDTAPVYPVTQPAQPALSGCMLSASAGPLSGMTFPLHTGDIVIGRKASQCSIVYPDGTPGVSGIHCRVSYAGGGYTVTDLGSKFGTYINGHRLTPYQPSAPLRPGDAIGMGSQKVVMVFTTGAV